LEEFSPPEKKSSLPLPPQRQAENHSRGLLESRAATGIKKNQNHVVSDGLAIFHALLNKGDLFALLNESK